MPDHTASEPTDTFPTFTLPLWQRWWVQLGAVLAVLAVAYALATPNAFFIALGPICGVVCYLALRKAGLEPILALAGASVLGRSLWLTCLPLIAHDASQWLGLIADVPLPTLLIASYLLGRRLDRWTAPILWGLIAYEAWILTWVGPQALATAGLGAIVSVVFLLTAIVTLGVVALGELLGYRFEG